MNKVTNHTCHTCVHICMDTNLLDNKFVRMGARLKIADRPASRNRTMGVIALDVQADSKGEFFEIVRPPGVDVEVAVLDVQPADHHLLLLVRDGKDKRVPSRPSQELRGLFEYMLSSNLLTCRFADFWRKRLGKTEFVAFQASARGGVVNVRVENDRALLGGRAVTVAKGELLVGEDEK
jgi:hypothetical protein